MQGEAPLYWSVARMRKWVNGLRTLRDFFVQAAMAGLPAKSASPYAALLEGDAEFNRKATIQNNPWRGQALLNRMRMRWALRIHEAPILSEVSRMRFGLALASDHWLIG